MLRRFLHIDPVSESDNRTSGQRTNTDIESTLRRQRRQTDHGSQNTQNVRPEGDVRGGSANRTHHCWLYLLKKTIVSKRNTLESRLFYYTTRGDKNRTPLFMNWCFLLRLFPFFMNKKRTIVKNQLDYHLTFLFSYLSYQANKIKNRKDKKIRSILN